MNEQNQLWGEPVEIKARKEVPHGQEEAPGRYAVTAISYGGGVQSTALVVLACTGRIQADVALFANVGETAEHPATLTYVREVAIPWAAQRGLPIHELHKRNKRGDIVDLRESVMREGDANIMIPARGSETGAPGSRACTDNFKIRVVSKWLKANGATADAPARVAIGISTDEVHRVNTRRYNSREYKYFPLIDLGLDRSACAQLIADAGLPVPPKSACYFCPFHRPLVWREMRRDEPDLFQRAVDLERRVVEKRAAIGKHPLYLTRFGRPLDEAIDEAQSTLPGFEGHESCDEGYCWT